MQEWVIDHESAKNMEEKELVKASPLTQTLVITQCNYLDRKRKEEKGKINKKGERSQMKNSQYYIRLRCYPKSKILQS